MWRRDARRRAAGTRQMRLRPVILLRPVAGLVVIAVSAIATAASAQTSGARAPAAQAPLRSAAAWTVRPAAAAADLPAGVLPRAREDALAATLQPRTAVAGVLAGDDVTGAIGFLCGRAPGQSEFGSAEAYGFDPQGRFVGAKLSYAF
jgi:hypothetical protein